MKEELTKKQYRKMLMEEVNQLKEVFENFQTVMKKPTNSFRDLSEWANLIDKRVDGLGLQIQRLDFAIEFENPDYPDGEVLVY